jgi:hypothetical protein
MILANQLISNTSTLLFRERVKHLAQCMPRGSQINLDLLSSWQKVPTGMPKTGEHRSAWSQCGQVSVELADHGCQYTERSGRSSAWFARLVYAFPRKLRPDNPEQVQHQLCFSSGLKSRVLMESGACDTGILGLSGHRYISCFLSYFTVRTNIIF